MEENLQQIIKRIDKLLETCNSRHYEDNLFERVNFELKQLTVAIAGKDSAEFEEYEIINQMEYSMFSEFDKKIPRTIALLGALKNKIILDGVVSKNYSSWEDLLNPIIYKASYKKFSDGYFSDSVESAIKEINVRIKKLYLKYKGNELDGTQLFIHAFSSKENECLFTAGENLTSQSGKDEQEGYKFLFMGLWQGIRNPKAHANTTITREQAIERLLFISMLMNKIEECIKKQGYIE